MPTGIVLHDIAWMARNADHENLVHDSFELIEKAKESLVSSSRFTPGRNDFDYCSALIVSKIQRFSQSTVVLLYDGNTEAAFVLLRAVYEDIFQLGYMATDPEKLGAQCRAYSIIDGLVHLQYRRRIGGMTSDESRSQLDSTREKYESVIEDFTKPTDARSESADLLDRKFFDNWTKLSLGDVATKADLRLYFDTTYKYCLSFVHGAKGLQQQYAVFSKEAQLEAINPNRPPGDRDLQHVMLDLTLAQLLTLDILCDVYQMDFPTEHTHVVERWRELVKKREDSAP
jgi:hypothetical protein